MSGSFYRTDEKYGEGFELSEYNGQFSLIAARESNTGKVFQRWGEIEIGKDKTKRLPVAVKLGSRDEAIDTLEAVIEELKGNGGADSWSDNAHLPNDDDTPF